MRRGSPPAAPIRYSSLASWGRGVCWKGDPAAVARPGWVVDEAGEPGELARRSRSCLPHHQLASRVVLPCKRERSLIPAQGHRSRLGQRQGRGGPGKGADRRSTPREDVQLDCVEQGHETISVGDTQLPQGKSDTTRNSWP
jgi:hypothetical protein